MADKLGKKNVWSLPLSGEWIEIPSIEKVTLTANVSPLVGRVD